MKNLFTALALMCFTFSTTLHAEEASKLPTDPLPEVTGPAVITPLQKSQPAPFAGILFSPRAAAVVGTEVLNFPQRLSIEVEKAVKDIEAKKQFEYNELNTVCVSDKTQMQARIDANQKRINVLEKDLQDAQDAVPNRWAWFGLGAAAGVAVTVGTVFVVLESTK